MAEIKEVEINAKLGPKPEKKKGHLQG
jgi:hypothetical protein